MKTPGPVGYVALAFIMFMSLWPVHEFGSASALPLQSVTPHLPIDVKRPALDLKAMGLDGGVVVSVPRPTVRPNQQRVRVVIPFEGTSIVLNLVRHSVRDESFRMLVGRKNGEFESVPALPIETYRGSIENDAGSLAAVSILPDGIAGRIRSGDGRERWIEPIDQIVEGAAPWDHVVYEANDVTPHEGRCGVADGDHGGQPLGATRHQELRMPGETMCSAQIAIDCDYSFYQLMGESLENLGRRVDLVLNTMNLQYNSQVGIDHKLTLVLVRTTEEDDPYEGSTLCDFDTNGLEDQVNTIWSAFDYLPDVTRDIVHLFTARPTGSIIGCNWIGKVCRDKPYGASRIDYNENLSCSTDLLAHELGHGWNATHCSCSSPAYTMNSSLTCANNFQPAGTIPTIIAYRDANMSCLDCAEEETTACGNGNSSCYQVADPFSPFCSDESCCIIVCAIDNYCCIEDWDVVCVDFALEICAGCGSDEAGSAFEANGTPGCSDPDCCETVCAIDAYCCTDEWDVFCRDLAIVQCTGCADDDAGSPYQSHGAGSNDPECCENVCESDIFCCNEQWDELCVESAVVLCAGCGDEEAGSPFTNNGSPGCEDIGCCIRVCENDPYCCESNWDAACARSAAFRCFGWCEGDFNFDGLVDGGDLGLLISEWGSRSAQLEDLNDDTIVDGADLGYFLGEWGVCDY